jgi:hypothetical protein
MQCNPAHVEKGTELARQLEAQKDRPGCASALHMLNLEAMYLGELPEVADAFEKSVHEAFKKALEQADYNEAVGFFQGFAKGPSKQGFRAGKLDQDTLATPIYLKVWAHWQEVDRLQNVTELHNFLLKNGFTEATLGDPDRLKRLCGRIKYAPGKRGRPELTQIKPELRNREKGRFAERGVGIGIDA